MEGYVKAFRSLLEWEWYTEPNVMRLFIHCLLNANYQQSKWRGDVIPAGSFITSSLKLSEELLLTRNQIRYALAKLEETKEITIKSTNRYTQINVINWAKYQCDDLSIHQQIPTQITNKSPTNHQQITTDKEIKEIQEIKELKELNTDDKDLQTSLPTINVVKKSKIVFIKPTVEEVAKYCLERENKIDAETFVAYYETRGWILSNKNQMKDWKSAIITWEKNSVSRISSKSADSNGFKPKVDKIGKPTRGIVL